MTRQSRKLRHPICVQPESDALLVAISIDASEVESALRAEIEGHHRQSVIQVLNERITRRSA